MTARTIDLRVFVFIGFPFKVDLELGRSKDAGNEPARKRILRKRNHHPLSECFECAYTSEGQYKIQQEARRKG
jgi:hypothetical protein